MRVREIEGSRSFMASSRAFGRRRRRGGGGHVLVNRECGLPSLYATMQGHRLAAGEIPRGRGGFGEPEVRWSLRRRVGLRSSVAGSSSWRGVGEVGLRKPRPRPARLTIFGPRTDSVSRRNLRGMGLTETLTLLILRENCCAGKVPHGGAGLRCRRHGWLYFGDEGSREPGTRCAGREHRVRDQRRHGRDARRAAMRPRRDRYFGAEGAGILDMWLPPTCKEGSVQGRDKGCRVYRRFGRTKTRWRPVRRGDLLLYPCKVLKAVCQERKRCN
jgi:hypothetical protein